MNKARHEEWFNRRYELAKMGREKPWNRRRNRKYNLWMDYGQKRN